jgi:hypothetical protein
MRPRDELTYRIHRADLVASIIENGIRWPAACVIAFFGYLSIRALAGQHTVADIGIRVLGNLQVSEAVAWIFGGSGIVYGWRQRKLRRDKVERLQGRVRALETERDPNRSSSGLTPRGETHPEDLQ